MPESAVNLKTHAGSAWHVNADQIMKDLGFVSGSGSPVSVVTPDYIGQEYFDTSGAVWWRTTTLVNTGWAPVTTTDTAAELAVLHGVTAGTVTASKALVVDSSSNLTGMGTITFADGKNLATGTTTGMKIGTATNQLLGFFNATPVVQPTTTLQAAVPTTAVTTAATSTTPFGYATSTQANNLAIEVAALVVGFNQMRTDLIALGLEKGS